MIANLQPLLMQATIQSFIPKCAQQRFASQSIDELIAALTLTTTQEQVHAVCSKAREKYGFDYFALYLNMPSPQAKPFVYIMREFSNSWTSHYEKNRLLLNDPSIPIVLARSVPSIWIPGKYENLMNDQQVSAVHQAFDFGVRKVIGFSVRGGDGGQMALRFHKQVNGLSGLLEEESIQCHSELSLFSNYVYEALQRVLKNSISAVAAPATLTNKELEILKWVASGYPSWAVGEKMFISENTVLKHLKNIHQKFDVRTRQHAVAKAVAMGLIQLA